MYFLAGLGEEEKEKEKGKFNYEHSNDKSIIGGGGPGPPGEVLPIDRRCEEPSESPSEGPSSTPSAWPLSSPTTLKMDLKPTDKPITAESDQPSLMPSGVPSESPAPTICVEDVQIVPLDLNSTSMDFAKVVYIPIGAERVTIELLLFFPETCEEQMYIVILMTRFWIWVKPTSRANVPPPVLSTEFLGRVPTCRALKLMLMLLSSLFLQASFWRMAR
jgi:hypothetical protein